MLELAADKQIFFNDNLRIYSYYMTHLSKSLYHFVLAYKCQRDEDVLVRNLDLAKNEAIRAQQYLFEGEHGLFSTWYSDAEPLSRTFQIDALINRLELLKDQAVKK
jgi:hypothetical protein